MKLLLITSDFPNPCEPAKALFNLYLARALARRHEVRVIAPVPWVDEWRAWARGEETPTASRSADVDGVEVHYPRYFYPPRVLRARYAGFYWQSVRGTV